jgi:plastocyanin
MLVSLTSPTRRGLTPVLSVALAVLVFGLAGSTHALAAELAVEMTIKDHKFQPATLNVPAGTPIKITVRNLDDTPEEFESYELKFEKVIAGKQSAVVRLKPLERGTYSFFGEYHADTAKGALNAE